MLLGLRRFQTVLIIGALVLTEKIAIMVVTTVVLTVLKHFPYQRIQIYVTNMTLQKKMVVSHHLTGQVFQTV
jgi:hypothetical protein